MDKYLFYLFHRLLKMRTMIKKYLIINMTTYIQNLKSNIIFNLFVSSIFYTSIFILIVFENLATITPIPF
ncbi:hypothetical protein HZS_3561, partial [Henneguya salminicola]